MKPKIKLFLISLVIFKICLGLVFLFQVELGALFAGSDAIASESGKYTLDVPEKESDNTDDPQIDLALVVQKMNRLEAKEKELEQKRLELAAFEAEIDRKIETLTQLRNDIKSQMAHKKTIEQQKIKHLMKAYSAMKPQSAAALIERLDRPFAIQLLSNMKGEAAGKILTYVDKEKAADLIEGLVERN
jgi:flagellar motility protein MotE (MotC chaperone)